MLIWKEPGCRKPSYLKGKTHLTTRKQQSFSLKKSFLSLIYNSSLLLLCGRSLPLSQSICYLSLWESDEGQPAWLHEYVSRCYSKKQMKAEKDRRLRVEEKGEQKKEDFEESIQHMTREAAMQVSVLARRIWTRSIMHQGRELCYSRGKGV